MHASLSPVSASRPTRLSVAIKELLKDFKRGTLIERHENGDVTIGVVRHAQVAEDDAVHVSIYIPGRSYDAIVFSLKSWDIVEQRNALILDRVGEDLHQTFDLPWHTATQYLIVKHT